MRAIDVTLNAKIPTHCFAAESGEPLLTIHCEWWQGIVLVERAFLYLVKDDEAYVVDGNAESAAATAYRNICMNSGLARKGSAPTREP